uniref:NADH dehydrogenase [ubiquinone] 1 alpha subcomplex subunit 12 n=1 Tax=Globodera rostochiensis TaxID=31243 RepID=A0A914HH93_GLORO
MFKPPPPTRTGPWIVMWQEFWASFSRAPKKHFVGEDSAGNRFYEYLQGHRRGNVQRGFDAPPGVGEPTPPPVEWLAWLSMARRFPPSEEEIRLNVLKQQAQLAQNEETEKRAPKIESKGVGAADMDKKQSFASSDYPKYGEEYEEHPGSKRIDQLEREQKTEKYKKFWFER